MTFQSTSCCHCRALFMLVGLILSHMFCLVQAASSLDDLLAAGIVTDTVTSQRSQSLHTQKSWHALL